MKGIIMKLTRLLSYVYTIALVILLSSLAFSQNTPSEDEQYLAFASTMPELQGGMAELVKKIMVWLKAPRARQANRQ